VNRRTTLAQLVVFGLISLLVVGYAAFDLLGVKLTDRPFPVTVQLRTGGGIFDGAEVTYRGVAVGRVSGLRLGTEGVTLTLSLDAGTRVPDNAVANVYDLSAVGEQYVDLVPTGPSAHYLHGGSVIPPSRTTTPVAISTVLFHVEQFLAGLDPQDLQILGTEGAKAFAGTGSQLKQILAGAGQILDELTSTGDATVRLLANSALLLRGAAAHAGDLATFARSLQALSATLAAATPTVETFLDQAPSTTALVNRLIRDNGSAIGVLLANLATFGNIQVARVPGLKALLVAVPQFGREAPTLVRGDAINGVINFNQHSALCPSGVPLTNPISGTRSPLMTVGCQGLPRGASNAPPATGSVGAAAIGSAQLTADGAAQVAGYDPASGLVSGSDGALARLGADGGQDQVLGSRSWEAVLLAAAGG
jgi:phospholipid/cholesterol/gamma-HCH transport system substrate-binding protein